MKQLFFNVESILRPASVRDPRVRSRTLNRKPSTSGADKRRHACRSVAPGGTGDWRTKTNPSPCTRVRDQIKVLNPHLTIHFGDVYYAGTGEEEQHILVKSAATFVRFVKVKPIRHPMRIDNAPPESSLRSGSSTGRASPSRQTLKSCLRSPMANEPQGSPKTGQ